MDKMTSSPSQSVTPRTVESIARVIRVEGAVAWLEPEQTASCGHCAASASCSGGSQAPGIGTIASRLETRRFRLANPPGPLALRDGERVVLGVDNRALIKAALLAYALPLGSALVAGGAIQGVFADDLASLLGMAAGLGFGLLAAHLGARRLARRGDLSPHFLRRALPGETCTTL